MSNKLDILVEKVQELMGREYEVVHRVVTKNNGIRKNAIAVRTKEMKIHPNIYIEDDDLDNYTIEVLASMVCEKFKEMEDQSYTIDENKFEITEDYVLDNVFMTTIGLHSNEQLLENVPHGVFLDMAVIFRVRIDILDNDYSGTFLVNNDLLKKMNIDKKELFEAAKANTTVNDVQIIDIIQAFAMSEMFGLDVGVESLSVMTLENMKLNSYTPYAISNKEGRYGAVYMMNYVLMEQISKELGGDFYILPPSIHGIIVIGIEDETDSEERHIDAIMHLKEMVIEVNKSEVPLEDVLTNTIYKYDSKKGEVVIA